MENVDFHDFLDRMRNPAAADLVRSIKSFIIDFSSKPPDPEKDSISVQEFMTSMEATFKVHPLWAGATDEELESAGEGLEKYLMTKLFSRAFAPLPEDAEHDQKVFEKICLLQQFIRPEHLDIPPNFQNETSWLLAQKELQKINTFKAPRDKLVSILNCSRVILNVSMAANENPPGADEFLPVLIYVIIKANPPQLHSNLLYIQRYRHQSRLVSEAAYFYTNLVSAETFIENLDESSLSLDEREFEKKMQAARGALDGMVSHPRAADLVSEQLQSQFMDNSDAHGPSSKAIINRSLLETDAKVSVANLETNGSLAVLDADRTGHLARDYPFLYASVGDLRVEDVESLLNDYKELVLKYHALCKAVEKLTPVKTLIDGESGSGGARVAACNEDARIPVSTQTEPSRDLSPPGMDERVGSQKDSESEAEKELHGKLSLMGDSDAFDGLTIHNASLGMEDKNVTFEKESLGSGFNLDTLQEQIEGTVGDDNGAEEKKIIEQDITASGSDLH